MLLSKKIFPLQIKENIAYKYTSHHSLQPNLPLVVRRNVLAILQDIQKQRYLCINWIGQANPWQSFVMGGVEKDESWVEAGRREIIEETGFEDFDFVRQIPGQIHSEYFAKHKGENRYSIEECYLFQLKSNKRKPNFRPDENHELIWLEEKEIADFLTQSGGQNSNLIFWQRFLNPDQIMQKEGVLFNSGEFDGLTSSQAKEKITQKLEQLGLGKSKTNYKLRNWVFSRQRYWGEPFPFEYKKIDDQSSV